MSIEVVNLYHQYMRGTPFEKNALKGVDLSIADGEFLGIIGHTGSGKSTLVQHFNGLLKPTTGKVVVHGIDIAGSHLKELRKYVGMVFQYPEHQLFEETVAKDIAFGLKKKGLGQNEISECILKTISLVGLDESILEKSPFELSGGQKRRVAIAGVIAMKPQILILDEPTAGLDPRGRDEILSFISQLHQSEKMTIILVSHSMEDISRLAQRVVVMNQGSIHMVGSTRDIFMESDRLLEIGLSAPQITMFMKRLKTIYPQINDRILSVAEAKEELKRILIASTVDTKRNQEMNQ